MKTEGNTVVLESEISVTRAACKFDCRRVNCGWLFAMEFHSGEVTSSRDYAVCYLETAG